MSEQRVIIDAFTELAPRYEQVVDGELKRFWGWSYDGFIDNLINLTSVKEGETVLDVATGTGVIPLKLAVNGQGGKQIVGLDITHSMLLEASQKIKKQAVSAHINLTCASAMLMPYRAGIFDVILCGLATHHLDVPVVLAEMIRILKPGGRLTIADVGASAVWRLPVINTLIRTATFLYFLPREGRARARAEAGALAHVLTAQEWEQTLVKLGFESISIIQLETKRFWTPPPLVIRALKSIQED